VLFGASGDEWGKHCSESGCWVLQQGANKVCNARPMKKQTAIALLGGTVREVATNLGCSTQAVYQWPDDGKLPRATADRVIATHVRMRAAARQKWLRKRGMDIAPIERDMVAL
jgi:hypothetical protein